MESSLDSCVWHQFSNGDIKNPDITSLLFHQKRRLSPCTSLQRTNSCWLCGLGGSRKSGGECGEFSQSWGPGGNPGYYASPGTDPLVTMTTSLLGTVWVVDKNKPLHPSTNPVRRYWHPLLTRYRGLSEVTELQPGFAASLTNSGVSALSFQGVKKPVA